MSSPRISFEEWKRLLDHYLETLIGLDSDCLPDAPYHRWYTENLNPHRAAKRALARAKEF